MRGRKVFANAEKKKLDDLSIKVSSSKCQKETFSSSNSHFSRLRYCVSSENFHILNSHPSSRSTRQKLDFTQKQRQLAFALCENCEDSTVSQSSTSHPISRKLLCCCCLCATAVNCEDVSECAVVNKDTANKIRGRWWHDVRCDTASTREFTWSFRKKKLLSLSVKIPIFSHFGNFPFLSILASRTHVRLLSCQHTARCRGSSDDKMGKKQTRPEMFPLCSHSHQCYMLRNFLLPNNLIHVEHLFNLKIPPLGCAWRHEWMSWLGTRS